MSAVRTTSRLAFAALGVALLFVVAAPSAGAQDPYGSTTTTAPDDPRDDIEATCGLSLSEGRPGDRVTATVNGVFLGEKVSIFFDSLEVGSTTAPDVVGTAAGRPVLFGGTALPAQTAVTSVQITFTVPPASPGTHIVTAVGDTFTCFCNPNGEFKVLAAKTAAKGGLPRTGIYVGLFVVIAIALLVLGRALVAASRRRQADTRANPFIDDERTEDRDPSPSGQR